MKTLAAIQPAYELPLVVDEIDIPEPGPDETIVKLFSSGICHSQLHQMHRPVQRRPLGLGHEGIGVVTHAGRDVKHVAEGDRAIVTWVPRTPIRGRPVFPPTGAFYRGEEVGGTKSFTWTEDTLADADYVVRVADDAPKDVSCIVGCAVLTGAGAVLHTAKVRPGDSVAIFGVGGVGMSAVRMASILEAYPIIAVDLKDEKLEFAKEFGATHVVNASEQDPVEAVLEISGGGVDYAFDAIGLRVTNEQILPATREGGPGAGNDGGMAVLVGVPGDRMAVDPKLFMIYQRQYRGSLGATYPDRDFAMYLRWHAEGKFPLDKLVTRRYRLEQINEACEALESGQILGRAIIEF